jgi:hypothetical protein
MNKLRKQQYLDDNEEKSLKYFIYLVEFFQQIKINNYQSFLFFKASSIYFKNLDRSFREIISAVTKQFTVLQNIFVSENDIPKEFKIVCQLKTKPVQYKIDFKLNNISLINQEKEIAYNSPTLLLAKSKLQIYSTRNQEKIEKFIQKYQQAKEVHLKMNVLDLIHLSFQEIIIDNHGLEPDESEILDAFQTFSSDLDSFNLETNEFSFSILCRFSSSDLNWINQSLKRFVKLNQIKQFQR